jgi:hypothetical protein
MDDRRWIVLVLIALLLAACSRSEPTIPLPHEMPPLETVVPWQALPASYSLLTPTDLDNGWRGEACPVSQPFFCLYDGQSELVVASLSLSVFPLERNEIMRDLLETEGLDLGHAPRPDDDAYIRSAHTVLTLLAEGNLDNVTQSAAAGYAVVPLSRQPIEIGPLPGLALGHIVQDESGRVVDYARFYAAFDGDVLYWMALLPEETAGFSDAETATAQMTPLETAAVSLLSHLKLPPAVVVTDVERVRVELPAALTAVLGEGVIQLMRGGETFAVRGLSEDGKWWYVDCPQSSLATSCWLPNDTGRVRPR